MERRPLVCFYRHRQQQCPDGSAKALFYSLPKIKCLESRCKPNRKIEVVDMFTNKNLETPKCSTSQIPCGEQMGKPFLGPSLPYGAVASAFKHDNSFFIMWLILLVS